MPVFEMGTRIRAILQLLCLVGVVGGKGMGAYQAGVQLQESLASGRLQDSPLLLQNSGVRIDDGPAAISEASIITVDPQPLLTSQLF